MHTDVNAIARDGKIDNLVNSIASLSRGKELLIGFDRDGTLVPYAERPEQALLKPAVHELIRTLAARPRVIAAIVSARSVAYLGAEFNTDKLIVAGNYGLEIVVPNQEPIIQKAAQRCLPALKAARDRLAELARLGAILEDHGYSVCLHWHPVPAELRPSVHKQVEEVGKMFPELILRAQPTSYEILPDMEWDKGAALAAIDAAVPPEAQRTYVFVGDSIADEPAFRWVNARRGISVRVGSAGENTESKFQLADTLEAEQLIKGLVDVCRLS